MSSVFKQDLKWRFLRKVMYCFIFLSERLPVRKTMDESHKSVGLLSLNLPIIA